MKKIIGWGIGFIYSAILSLGMIYLIEMEIMTKALILAVTGIITIIVAVIVLKDKILAKSFFINGILLTNIAAIYVWDSLTSLWKALAFALFAAEVLYVLLKLYNKINFKTGKRRNYGIRSSAQVNIIEFCKAKYHNTDEVNGCMARLLNES